MRTTQTSPRRRRAGPRRGRLRRVGGVVDGTWIFSGFTRGGHAEVGLTWEARIGTESITDSVSTATEIRGTGRPWTLSRGRRIRENSPVIGYRPIRPTTPTGRKLRDGI